VPWEEAVGDLQVSAAVVLTDAEEADRFAGCPEGDAVLARLSHEVAVALPDDLLRERSAHVPANIRVSPDPSEHPVVVFLDGTKDKPFRTQWRCQSRTGRHAVSHRTVSQPPYAFPAKDRRGFRLR
jgi:hypothetical protein